MEDCEVLPSLLSLQHIRPIELYPKTQVITEDERLKIPYSPLCGEHVSYLGRTATGVLALSNYRVYHQTADTNNTFNNIPLGLIEQVEVKDILHLHILCKDATLCRLSFSTSEMCLEWMRRLTKATSPDKNMEDVFAFALFAWANEEGSDELLSRLGKDSPTASADNFNSEVERLQFDVSEDGPWRVSLANNEYQLCASYPRRLLVPSRITDNILDGASRFRSSRRVPAIVWRHKINGAVIARCSQPEVGWLGWRSADDEVLLKAITDACNPDPTVKPKKLLVLDARSYATAVANRARGGGCECADYYPTCDIDFMNLANIHAVRKSFSTLRSICWPSVEQPNWFSLLDGSRWLHNISGLISAALIATSAIEINGRPVLVHCSDGWDRTPEIVSLTQLLLDPYYRTIEGFRVLVEREWLEFGHKFGDRCGFFDDTNERCPVFLQWLDCVQNITKQFPCEFQFNSNYLIKLAQHTYSNMFGTFLCNNSRMRAEMNIASRTFSVWNFMQSPQYVNQLYTPQEKVLWPSCNIRDLELWRELYLGTSSALDNLPSPKTDIFYVNNQDNNANVEAEFMNGEDLNGNGEEQNNHLEEIDLGKNEEYKSNKEIENQKPVDEILRTNCDKATVITGTNDILSGEGVPADGSSSPLELDTSVESSTETLLSSSNSPELPSNPSNLLPDSSSTMIGCGRSIPALLDPVDGLTPLRDHIQQRLTQMVLEHKAKEIALERELHTTRLALLQQVCHQCSHASPPERPDDDGSVCSTEVSWEAVEEQEALPTLWVPDHAVSHCMGCHNQFWLGRRKHHCRSCGKVFCADCSENTVPLPEEQLYEPVRVCAKCYTTSSPTTCKQAASAVQALLPPASAHTQA